jgi:hypothetical protein
VPRRSDDRDLPIEWIDVDERRVVASRRSARRTRRSWVTVAAAGVAVGIATAVAVSVVEHGRAAQPQMLPPPGNGVLPETIRLAHPVLAVPATWELIARGPELLRINLRRGVVTRTDVPTLRSGGPSFLIVQPHQVTIRPLDGVPGYVVADGQPARVLTGPLGQGGPAFPGPDDQVWVFVDGTPQRMVLIGANGEPTGRSVDSTDDFPVGGDETGLLVMNNRSGTYLAGAGRPELITTGNLLAIGPTRWLTAERTPRGCTLVVTDRAATATATHTLGATTCSRDVPFPGVISPSGRTAAIVVETGPGVDAIHVVDLRSGADHQLAGRPIFGDGSNGHLVWSPDSRTLFFLTLEGQIVYTDARGSRVRPLPLDMRVTTQQIAFRVVSP